MNTKKDIQDTLTLMQDSINDAYLWSVNNGDSLGEELSEMQQLIIEMRNRVKLLKDF